MPTPLTMYLSSLSVWVPPPSAAHGVFGCNRKPVPFASRRVKNWTSDAVSPAGGVVLAPLETTLKFTKLNVYKPMSHVVPTIVLNVTLVAHGAASNGIMDPAAHNEKSKTSFLLITTSS